MAIDTNTAGYDAVEDLVDLRAVWVGLRRRAGLFAAVATTTFLAVVAYAFLAPSLYTAETSLMIEPKTEVFGYGEDVFSRLPADPQLVDTEVELLRSRGMAILVANRLDAREELANASSAEGDGDGDFLAEKFTEAAADFNEGSVTGIDDSEVELDAGVSEAGAGAVSGAMEAVADVAGEEGAAGEAAAGKAEGDSAPSSITDGDASAVEGILAGVTTAPTLKDVAEQADAVFSAERQEELRKLQSKLEVARVGTTFLIKLRYTSPSPERAAEVANAFAEEYILQQVETQFDALNQANRWINARLEVLRKEVRAAEEKTGVFRAEQGLMDTAGSQSFTEQRISSLASELALAKTELATVSARYYTARSYTSSNAPLESIGEVMKSTVVTELRRQQAEITRRKAELTIRYGDLHPELKKINGEYAELQAQIDREVNRIIESLRAEVNFASSRVAALEKDLQEIQGDLFTNNSAQVNLLELERDLQASRGVYEALLNRQKELNERDRLAEANARIVARAEPPQSPSQPRKKILLAGGMILALLMGGATSFAVETMDNRIRNTADMRKEFGPSAPVVLVPRVQSRMLFRQRQGDEVAHKFIIEEPHSLFAESMRDLRVHLKAAEGDTDEGVAVAFTSAFRNEGKSTTAISFATLLANSGRRVAFLDCATGQTEFLASNAQEEQDFYADDEPPELVSRDAIGAAMRSITGPAALLNADDDDAPEVEVLPKARYFDDDPEEARQNNLVAGGGNASNYELVVERKKQTTKYPLTVASHKSGVAMFEFTDPEVNPHNDFNARSFAMSLEDLRTKYDYIIVDAPALLPRAEASNIAGAADFAVMVTEWCTTTRGAARVGVQRLLEANAKILSFVVNKVDEKQRFYFRPEDRHFFYRRAG